MHAHAHQTLTPSPVLLEFLSLHHFRNYPQLELDLTGHQKVALIGPNAQGKSNFLEAIYVMAFASSFRTSRMPELIHWNAQGFSVRCRCRRERGDDFLLGYETRKNGKRLIQYNHTYQKRLIDYIGHLKLVLFSQGDLNLITGPPHRRRLYMDLLLIQCKPGYYKLLQSYNRVMKQRNVLLKSFKDYRSLAAIPQTQKDHLDLWDTQLSQLAALVVQQRKMMLDALLPLIKQKHVEMSGLYEELDLEYRSAITDMSAEGILDLLHQKRRQDIFRAQTSVGPHRDDVIIKYVKRDLKAVGSQGQIRTAALAMKVAELCYVKEKIGEYPILLLDDVFSELDIRRQQLLVEQISYDGLQSFITTTHLDQTVEKLLKEQGLILHVREGKIR